MLKLSMAAVAAAALFCSAAAQNMIPASDPRLYYAGRTQINADGTRSFDWEGTQIYINTVGCSYLDIMLNTTGPMTRITTQLYTANTWFSLSRAWVTPRADTNVYRVADNLDPSQNYTIRVYHELEPAFSGATSDGAFFTFVGFQTDGSASAATPLSRKIEFVGDSITAGYGSQCNQGGPVMMWTSGNLGDYSQQICDAFAANCTFIAWSGKGMYENCCDNGETMPSYYLQTRGGSAYATDWDFSRFVPDALVINLGTNDFGHDSGPAWEANFTATYVSFCLNATQRYGKPQLPIFLAQGNMNNGSPLQNALQNAATQINAAGGNAHYLDLRAGPTDGCGGHPGVAGHAAMYAAAKPVIAQVMNW